MLGRSDENLGEDDGEEVVELRDLDETLGEFAQVAHVDAALVHRLRQRDPVQRSRGVVETIADEGRNLEKKEGMAIISIIRLLTIPP